MVLGTAPAFASAGPPCIPATLTPTAKSIPVNLPGFGLDVTNASGSELQLVDVKRPKVSLALTIGAVQDGLLQVTPTAPLTAGETYTLTFSDFCSFGATSPQGPLTFTAAPEAPIPTTLGAIAGTPKQSVRDYGVAQVQFDVSYVLSPEMQPWAAVYTMALTFDGREVETHSTLTSAGDGISIHALAWCDPVNVKTTRHQILLAAKLPFSPTLKTDATQLDFTCLAPDVHGPPPSTPVAPPVGAAGEPSTDAQSSRSSHGGCTTGAADPTSALALTGVLAGLAACSRRRRARTKGGA